MINMRFFPTKHKGGNNCGVQEEIENSILMHRQFVSEPDGRGVDKEA